MVEARTTSEVEVVETSSTSAESMNPARPSRAGIAAILTAALGCLGWLLTLPLLDACDQSEKLARFFAAFLNQVLLAAVGGPSTILLFVGLAFSRRAFRLGHPFQAKIAKVVSILGLMLGTLVLLFYLPTAIHFLY